MNNDGNQGNAAGTSIVIREVKALPFVDAHMHIQSNDISPLPLMKGLTYFKGAKTFGDAKKNVNHNEWSFRDMGKFTRDNISPTAFTHESVVGNLLTAFAGSEREDITDRAAGFPVTLVVKEYGKITRNTSFNIAGIYMNEFFKNSMGYSSRRTVKVGASSNDSSQFNEDSRGVTESYEERERLVEARKKTIGNFRRIITGYYDDEKSMVNGGFEFSVVLGMELMYAHYWGAYGIPIYIAHGERLYYVSNDLDYISIAPDYHICYTAYDIEHDTLWQNYRIKNKSTDKTAKNENIFKHRNKIDFFKERPANINPGNGYKHYLVPLEKEEIVQYEDFKQHMEYTRMAVLMYPFKLLPFYHFDPRRFFGPALDETLHEFYTKGRFDLRGNTLVQIPSSEIKDSIGKDTAFKNKYDINDLKKELLHEGGLFWGIKMYAALGYPPYLYDKNERTKIFPHLDQDGQYSGLLDFYTYCAQKDIPIICHGSPQGMTIADPGVYLKEYLKRQNKSKYYADQKVDFPVGAEQFVQGIGLIDDFSSPGSWRIVLNKLAETGLAQKFRLCLAHYGGMGFLSGEYNDKTETPYRWHKDIAKLINDFDQVYTDLSCYTIETIPDLPSVILPPIYNRYKEQFPAIEKIYEYKRQDTRARMPERYLLKSDFPLDNTEEKSQVLSLRLMMIEENKKHARYKKVYSIAEKLTEDLKEKGKLRYRIMFGTDWPMSEMRVTGVTDYTASMFVLCQLVTDLMGGEWDAWHQFTVINPLRFLGLLEEVQDEDQVESLAFQFDKLDTYKEQLDKYIEENWAEKLEDKYNMRKLDVMEAITKNHKTLGEKYKGTSIPTASSKYMRKDGQENGPLKILRSGK